MINILLYIFFLTLFLPDYVHYHLEIAPRFVTWLPELFGVLFVFISVIEAVRTQNLYVNLRYIILACFYLLIIICGIIVNSVSGDAIFIGIRNYFKYFPLFILPAVVEFTERDFKKLLIFVLVLALLQSPLAIYQRVIQYKNVLTGDYVTGSLRTSGILSITLLCSVGVVFAFYLKKKIGIVAFFCLLICLTIPTTLNETKATLILFPLAGFVPAYFVRSEYRSRRIRAVLLIGLICVCFFSAFIPIYDYYMKPREGLGLIDYWELEVEGQGYLYRGAKGLSGEYIGRGDAIIFAYKRLTEDVGSLAFGLGIGNVMDSHFGGFSGKYAGTMRRDYKGQGIALTYIGWELGLLGLIAHIVFFLLILKDALRLRMYDDLFGAFSLGWCAVVISFLICLVYTNYLTSNILVFAFTFFSGVIASKVFLAERINDVTCRENGSV